MRVMRFSKGDTVIEVLFAITIFSLIAVGGLSIMNQGLSIAQRSLEIGLVRQQIDAQADALRYLSRAYAIDYGKNGEATQLWNDIVVAHSTPASIGAQAFDTVGINGACHIPSDSADNSSDRYTGNAFALDLGNSSNLDTEGNIVSSLTTGEVLSPTSNTVTYARINYDASPDLSPPPRAEGIWIQAVESPTIAGESDRPGFYDFHIRACWLSPGQPDPITLGTIVRLYEPRG